MILDQLNYETLLVPLNKFYDLHTGGPRRPVFFDIDSTRPELRELDRNFAVIREELMGILPEKRAIPRYHELDQMQYNISARVDPDRDWKIYPLNIMGVKPKAFCRAAHKRRPCWTEYRASSRPSSQFWKGVSRSRRTTGPTGAISVIISACLCRR